jgi:RNA polymerase sigma-70 factor (ECF subfamily)
VLEDGLIVLVGERRTTFSTECRSAEPAFPRLAGGLGYFCRNTAGTFDDTFSISRGTDLLKPTREQFEKLALDQLDTLYRIARRLARDPQRAEDLVQETYLRAVRARETFDLQAHGIRPWLLRIMHNVHVSKSEREGRQPAAIEDEQLESAAGGGSAGVAGGGGGSARARATPPPYDQFSFDGMDQQLVRAIEGLAPEYQIVLMLWAVEELSYKEIAQAVGIPIGTVMSRLHRARQKLSEQLRNYAKREGIIRE